MWTSPEAGGTWQQGARLGAAPDAVAATSTAGGTLRIAVVTTDALQESSDGGQAFTVVLEH